MDNKKKDLENHFSAEETKRLDIAAYRKHAMLADNTPITKDTIDDWALTAACVERNCDKDQMLDSLLGDN